MSTKLYVSNLPLSITAEALITQFCKFGCVLSVVLDPVARAERRGALVEMDSRVSAKKAIASLNLTDYEGRLVSVFAVREPPQRWSPATIIGGVFFAAVVALAAFGTLPAAHAQTAQTQPQSQSQSQPQSARLQSAAAQTAPAVPENATSRRYGGWACNRGYERRSDSCVAVVVPPHAYLSSGGDTWECERLFRKRDGGCEPVRVPANGFADDRSNVFAVALPRRHGDPNARAIPAAPGEGVAARASSALDSSGASIGYQGADRC